MFPSVGGRRAFTLLELVAVLAVLSILLALALPDMDASHRTYVLDSAASEVLAALRFAQSRSIHTGVDHGCEFSAADDTIRCFQVSGSPPYPTVNHPVRKTPYTLDFDASPGHGGVTISSVTFAASTVIFDSLGSPDSGGSVWVTMSGLSKVVTVTAVSGVIRVTDP